jgi:5-methylcytosine-specific restriction endonuclease McrA
VIKVSRRKVAEAQQNRCGICGSPFRKNDTRRDSATTWDHVHARAKFPALKHRGNIVLAHGFCNRSKKSRKPRKSELAMLRQVNSAMGWELSIDQGKFDGSQNVPCGAVLLLDRPV